MPRQTTPPKHVCPILYVAGDWRGWDCNAKPWVTNYSLLWNAITGPLPGVQHHAVWRRFTPWMGSSLAHQGVLVDFLGFKCPVAICCRDNEFHVDAGEAYADAIRLRLCATHKQLTHDCAGNISLRWPVVSEEYFEYVDILTAVSEYVREIALTCHGCYVRPFTFIDVGSGYGHWTFVAHLALTHLAGRVGLAETIRYRYLLVDTVDTQAVVHHLANLNSIGLNSAKGQLAFHHALITETGAFDRFGHGSYGFAQSMVHWYSSAWQSSTARQQLKAISLNELLSLSNLPCVVDIIDIDIQGGEYAILATNETIAMLTHRVRRIHIGLHSQVKQRDSLLMVIFRRHGWHIEWLWHSNLADNVLRQTRWGPAVFYDGVLTAVNSKQHSDKACDAIQRPLRAVS